MIDFSKVCIILRGVPSSSKTTFAEYLRFLGNNTINPIICCADDYFIDKNGNYNFDPAKLGEAHNQCKEKFNAAIIQQKPLIIIANTNSKESEFSYYNEKAKNNNYTVFCIVMEKRFEGENNHNVPGAVILRHEQNIKNSLKLR